MLKINLFKKIASFSSLALLLFQPVYSAMKPGQFCPPEDCAYNASAGPDLRCSWDLFVTGSFLYWKAEEEGLEPFITENDPIATTELTDPYKTTSIPSSYFSYKPAFKVALGINYDCDHWQLLGQYTWFHHTMAIASSNASQKPNSSEFDLADQGIIPIKLINKGSIDFNANYIRSINATWRLNLDLADSELSRHYFVGRCLTLQTRYGLRGAWIGQHYVSVWTASDFINSGRQVRDQAKIETKFNTTSWGIGPRIAVDTNWHLSNGFRIFGNGAASILYTEYSISGNETQTVFNSINGESISTPFAINSTHPSFLRPIGELGLGLAWGDYFDSCKWYIDLSIGYDFAVLWNQNMFPTAVDMFGIAVPQYPNGDLYLHGLTVTMSLSF